MFRLALFAIAAAALPAATVETTLLGTHNGPPPLTAGDGLGNVILLVPSASPCSILQECNPQTLVKLDPTGRILFRRALGDVAARFQPLAVAIDRQGNILIAGVTADQGLPTTRPLQPRHGGAGDVYLWQLSPDGASTTFASYLGSSGNDQPVSLTLDPAGFAVLALFTDSPDFPFTVNDGPATLPPGVLRQAIVRFSTAAGRISYAFGLPLGPPPNLSVGPDGTVYALSLDVSGLPSVLPPGSVLRELSPDGTRKVRPLPLPAGTVANRVLPADDGGIWVAGQAAGDLLATTNGALQSQPSGFTYQRWEGTQLITPPGPIRGFVVRQLAVDRADENRIYAGTLRGLARSDDNGWTWELVNDTPPTRNIFSLSASLGRLWAYTLGSTGPGLMSSVDAGVTWTAIPLPAAGVPLNLPNSLTGHPTNPDVLYLAFGSTLYSTRNAGESWTSRTFADTILAVAADTRAVAVQTSLFGSRFTPPRFNVYWSDDGGETFPKTLSPTDVLQGLRFDPNQPGRLYFINANRFARTSPENFPEIETISQGAPNQPPLVQFAFQNGLPGALAGILADGRLARSTDGGRVWQATLPVLTPGPNNVPPTQFQVAAGGVAHLAYPIIADGFVGKFTAAGDAAYLTYLGGRGSAVSALTRTATGLVVATGQTYAGDFPGERLGGPSLPPGITLPPSPGLFAVAFQDDASLVYSAVLTSLTPPNLMWIGPGAGANIVLVGTAFSPDFPGLPPNSGFFPGPQLFLSRLRP